MICALITCLDLCLTKRLRLPVTYDTLLPFLPPPDMQMVNITIRVLSKPDSSQLRWIFRTLGKDYDERVLPSIVNEVSKAVVAKYNAAELLTKR